MRKSLLACALLLCPTAFAATAHWEYSGEAGPAKWASLTPEYGQCAGSNQSPVNLAGLVEAELAPLQFHYRAGGKTLVNNGHTVQVNYAPGSTWSPTAWPSSSSSSTSTPPAKTLSRAGPTP